MMYHNEKADGVGANLVNIEKGVMSEDGSTLDFCISSELQKRMLKNTIFESARLAARIAMACCKSGDLNMG